MVAKLLNRLTLMELEGLRLVAQNVNPVIFSSFLVSFNMKLSKEAALEGCTYRKQTDPELGNCDVVNPIIKDDTEKIPNVVYESEGSKVRKRHE